jgi:hypothetical protein
MSKTARGRSREEREERDSQGDAETGRWEKRERHSDSLFLSRLSPPRLPASL